MEVFNFRDMKVKYIRTGKGKPVIFLHNGGASHVIWREVMPRIKGDYEMFAFDLLGYGSSDKPGAGYKLENYIAFVAAFVDEHNLVPVRLVGNCMGSAMSLGFAMLRPKDVQALVLINPLTVSTFLSGSLGTLLRLRMRKPAFSRRLYKRLGRMKLTGGIGSQALRFQVGSYGKSSKVHKIPELCACYANPGQLESLLGVLDDLENFAYLDQFKPGDDFPPFCTIWGQKNRILSSKAGRRLNETLHPSHEEWLSGCGHLPMLERPDEVASIISQFLSENE